MNNEKAIKKTMDSSKGEIIRRLQSARLNDVAVRLSDAGLISPEVYERLEKVEIGEDKARKILLNLMVQIDNDPAEKFSKLLEILETYDVLDKLVDFLKQKYTDNCSESVTSTPVTTKRTNTGVRKTSTRKASTRKAAADNCSDSTPPVTTKRTNTGVRKASTRKAAADNCSDSTPPVTTKRTNTGVRKTSTRKAATRKAAEADTKVVADGIAERESSSEDSSLETDDDDYDDNGDEGLPPPKKQRLGKDVLTSDLKYKRISEKTNKYFGLNLKEFRGEEINGSGLKIAIIDISQANQDQGIQLDHKAFDKPDDCTIEPKVVSSSTKNTCHALTCTAVAVGEPYNKAYLKCHKQVMRPNYPGGVAPKAKATVFLVDLTYKSINKALDTIIKAGDFDVVSMSFGGEHNAEMEKRLDALKDKTVLVAAAGNKGNNDCVEFPARHPAVISVGSLNTYFKVSEFSAENPGVDIYYCGEQLAPCSNPNRKLLKFSTGTSIATPGIAGLVCLLLQCAKKHGYEKVMKKKSFILKVLKNIIVKEQSEVVHSLNELTEIYKDKDKFDKLLV